jgi:hypothetical protein
MSHDASAPRPELVWLAEGSRHEMARLHGVLALAGIAAEVRRPACTSGPT